jgi:hypothetical protein
VDINFSHFIRKRIELTAAYQEKKGQLMGFIFLGNSPFPMSTTTDNGVVSKLVVFGKQPVNLGGTVKYYADSPDSGPHEWGARAAVTFLFPAK